MQEAVLTRQAEDAPFCANPADSFTIPARFYLDSEIYSAEQANIFYQQWWYAGHASQLAKAGDYLSTSIHDQNVFVVRDTTGKLNAYYNVCQHRGHELVSGNGNAAVIVCPYHAWSYDLDGSLRGARNTDGMPGFKKCDFALKPVRTEVFCGMVFINLDVDAVPLREQASELEREIRDYVPAVDSIAFAQRDTYHVKSNWKVMIDNFLECYHCHTAHKDFVNLVDMKSYRSVAKGIYSSHVSNAVKNTASSAFEFEKGDVDFGYAGWFLWPNLTIWAYPGEANLSILQMIPNGPENTIEYQDWFVPDGKPSKQLKDAMDYQKDVLQPEDISLCESVQRGLKSKGYNQGRFVIDSEKSELSEHAVHHFQEMVVDALGADLS
ncbi:MAG: aromatic ring-hydroxylating dioxygenase subunit alpha [Gammaproteobacteria bacterium]|nr:aromatic ring-hydroxylating dioxygenase subunit alpha [Gammaproteobacteria bacterium]